MSKNPFQLITNNGGWFANPTVELRTTKLPFHDGQLVYESCLFTLGASEVQECLA